MNLEVCKACEFCAIYPKDANPTSNPDRVHYHCGLASPKPTPHGMVFNADNPTNIIAEEYGERALNRNNPSAEPIKRRVIAFKAMFKIPAACPNKGKH